MNRQLSTIILFVLFLFNGCIWAQVPVLVKDINPGLSGSSPQFLTVFAGNIYFGTSDISGLWMSDGTEIGTVKADGLMTIGDDFATELTVYNSELFFNTSPSGFGLSTPSWWSTAGGINNANLIVTNLQAFGVVPYSSATLASDVMVFGGKDSSISGSPNNIFRSDGTSLATVAFGSFTSTASGPTPRGFWTVNSKLLFSAIESSTGRELYSTDATTGSTQIIKDIAPGVGSSLSDVTGTGGVVLGNELYIPAFSDNPSGIKLWKSDGSTGGTVAIYDATGVGNGSKVDYDSPKFLTAFNGFVYFFATAGTSPRLQLWRVSAGDVHPSQITFDPDFVASDGMFGCFGNVSPMVANGTLYFKREDNSNGCELWSSDGTTVGTQLIKDINPGGFDSFPILMGTFNGELYFTALKAGFGYELWHSDGTQSGTLMVSDLNPGTAGSIINTEMIEFNGSMYFIADDGTTGQELYKLSIPVVDPIFKDGFEQIGPI